MTPKMIDTCEAFILAYMQANHPTKAIKMSGLSIPGKAAIYVRFTVMASVDATPISLGKNAKSRNVGVIQIDVRGPTDKGARATGDLAWELSKIFGRQDVTVPGEGLITFKDPSVVDMGERGEEHWQLGRIPYRYDFTL